MKLGICCVYLFDTDSEWLLDLQLQYVRETLSGYDHAIYGAANRLRPELRNRLAREPAVKLVPLPAINTKGSPEHAYYLDLLLRHAAADGCTHLATIDADSFPVLPNWPGVLLERMTGKRLAAVHRTENLDTFLPHPCGLFMERSFLTDHDPKFLPPKEAMAEFRAATGQRFDTGIGYGYALWKSGEPWLPLLRSNRRNHHFLMAGIYGDTFFHLGASSREPWFYYDQATRLSLKVGPAVNKVPILWRMGPWLEKRYIAANRRRLRRISRTLRAEPAHFLASLNS